MEMDLMTERVIDTRKFDEAYLEKLIVAAAEDAVEAFFTDKKTLTRTMERLAEKLRELRRERSPVILGGVNESVY